MTQEEKAKAYDKALEKAKDTLQKSSAKDAVKTIVYHFFPELKESEDEIIRKELIRLFNDTVWNDSSFRFYDLDKEKVIAWLEKQDKQKLTWIEEDEKVRKALKEAGYEWSEETHELKKIEQKPVNKIEPIFNVGDYIERKDGVGCHAKIIFVGGNCYGCKKLIYSEDSSPFFEFMFENQDDFRVSSDFQQNPAWSEEDEKMIDEIIDYMKPMPIFFESTKGKSGKEYTQKFVKNAINWLKSLKERIGE